MNLKQWRADNRYSQATFAEYLWDFVLVVCKDLELPPPDKIVTGSHVQKWEDGCEPRRIYRLAIERATNGKVKPVSFL